MGDWAGLLLDLLVEIAKRIPLVEDFMAFRGVCTSWRTTAAHMVFNSWPTFLLLMLAEEENNDDREFYSLARGKVSMRLSLPEVSGKKCMEVRFGWFLTVDAAGGLELLHPFSRRTIELPHLNSFEVYDTDNPFMFMEIGVLSASPSHTSNFVLIVIYNGGCRLGFRRPGDKSWTRILVPNKSAFSNVNYYNGKFYAICVGGDVWVWDFLGTDLTVAEKLICLDLKLVGAKAYLVEWAGELLVVIRDGVCIPDYGATYFRVIQLDLIEGQWKVVSNLGDRSIFLGHNAAFSLNVTGFGGSIKANCIYFSDDCIETSVADEEYRPNELGGGEDMGVYNLKMEKASDSIMLSPIV